MAESLIEAELALAKKIIIGLGNPGSEYARTRHNLGFTAVHTFIKMRALNSSFETYKRSKVQMVIVDGVKVLLAKPTTYMNLSGIAVSQLLEATGLVISDVLVIHDDMDLPLGKAKMKFGGSSGGHKGITDIIARFGEGFSRIKIGIGKPDKQTEDAGIDWVLGEITPMEGEIFAGILPVVAEASAGWVIDGLEKTMSWFNARYRTVADEEPEGSFSDVNESTGAGQDE